MFDSMDFASVDYYPATDLADDSKSRMYHGALTLDLTRGIKQKNFWVMEQLSGTPGCWYPMSRTPFPGMIRAHAWQSISRGADTIVQFRWRSARIGAEQFWHGLLDHHGEPGRRFDEFVQFSKEVGKLASLLEGTTLANEVAMLFSHEQSSAFQIQPQSDDFDYFQNFKRLHSAFMRLGVGTDVIDWRRDFRQYKLVVAPMLYLIDERIAAELRDYVEHGGTLVLTTRTGVKNMDNVCLPHRLPNLLSELTGMVVDEYDPVGKDRQRVRFETLDNSGTFECSQWCDVLSPVTARAVAVYASEYFSGRAAVTRNDFGQGTVYYIGTVLDDAASQALLGHIVAERGVESLPGLPVGVETAVRRSARERVRFLLNLTKESKFIETDFSASKSALSGERLAAGGLMLAPGGVEILVDC